MQIVPPNGWLTLRKMTLTSCKVSFVLVPVFCVCVCVCVCELYAVNKLLVRLPFTVDLLMGLVVIL